jgi:DNA-binding IclR family transcriptional regulator
MGTNENVGSWRTVEAVQTSCRILNAMRENGTIGVTELSDRLDVSKAGIHSHLATLEENGLVVNEGGTYRISLFFLDFAEAAKNEIEFYDIIKGELDSLAEDTGEVAQFMVEEHGLGVYLYKAVGSSAVQTSSYVGNRKHLHCTALGKVILAYLDADRCREIIDQRGLPEQTENTITDIDILMSELDEIRDRGYAFDDEEVLKGLKCVAAPVRNKNDDLIGSISVSAPTSRVNEERFREELPQQVTHTANVIEIQINAAQFSTVNDS